MPGEGHDLLAGINVFVRCADPPPCMDKGVRGVGPAHRTASCALQRGAKGKRHCVSIHLIAFLLHGGLDMYEFPAPWICINVDPEWINVLSLPGAVYSLTFFRGLRTS